MLTDDSLPQWIKDFLTESIDAYLTLIDVVYTRCKQIEQTALKNECGELCDRHGTLDEYRLDGKYAAGQAYRMMVLLRERLGEASWKESPYAQRGRSPEELARWAWENPWRKVQTKVNPVAMDEAPLEWMEFYMLYPERERQALVYTIGNGMTLSETAQKMGIGRQAVQTLLMRARARGIAARDERVGIASHGYWDRTMNPKR